MRRSCRWKRPLPSAAALPAFRRGAVAALEHWRLHGKIEGGERCPVKTADVGALAEEAFAGVAALVARFDLPATPYPSRPRSSHAPKFSDYEHLARVREWSAGADPASLRMRR